MRITLLFFMLTTLLMQAYTQCIHDEQFKKYIQACDPEIHISSVAQPYVVFQEDNPRLPAELEVQYSGTIDSIYIENLLSIERCGNDQVRIPLFDNGEHLDKVGDDNIWTSKIPIRCLNLNTPFKILNSGISYKIDVFYKKDNQELKAEYYYRHSSLAVKEGFLSDLDTNDYYRLNDSIAYTNHVINIQELTDVPNVDQHKLESRLLAVDLFRKTWKGHENDIVSMLYSDDIRCNRLTGAFAIPQYNLISGGIGFNALNHELNHIWFNQNGLDLKFNRHHARYLERGSSGFSFEGQCYGGFFDSLFVQDGKIFAKVVPNEDWLERGIINLGYSAYYHYNDIELYLMGAIPIDSVRFPIRYIALEQDHDCIQVENNENLYEIVNADSIQTMMREEFEEASMNKISFAENSKIGVKFLLISKELLPKKELLALDFIVKLYNDYFKESTYGLAELNTQVNKLLDCNGSNENSSQEEIPYNDIDDDCNPNTLDNDLDQDGYLLEDDCDDLDATINPGIVEIPNNTIDENCDGIVESSTATDELSGIRFNIYPNPTSDYLFIDFESKLDVDIKLYGPTQHVFLQPTTSDQLDLRSLISGLYILVIKDPKTKQVLVRKIIKH